MEAFQASSISSDRGGLSRTGSGLGRAGPGLASPLKGGLASLLSAPPSAGTSVTLQRASYSSDQFPLSTSLSSDYPSLDSVHHSRSFQALGSLAAATPKSRDKSPSKWVFASKRSFVGFSPAFSPLQSSMAQLPLQRKTVGSLPSTGGRASSLHAGRAATAAAFPALAASLNEVGAKSPGTVQSIPLQAKPVKPADLFSFTRSVGFCLPRDSRSDFVLLPTIPSVDILPDVHDQRGQGPAARSRSLQDNDGFLTPACSFNTLPEQEESSGNISESTLKWEPSGLRGLGSELKKSTGIAPSGSQPAKPSDAFNDREQILRFVESSNGLREPGVERYLFEAQQEFPVFEEMLVKRAFQFAASAHEGQVRKNGDPSLVHLVETAKILASIGADSTVVAAGLLHDCLDDTPLTAEQLEASFGPSIASLVKGVSNLSSLSQRMRDLKGALSLAESDRLAESGQALSERQLDLLRTMILSLEDVRIVLVKLADRLHNLRTLSGLSEEKQRRVTSETLEVFAPLANRLGIWTWKAEIEDTCFRTLWPFEYRGLHAAVRGSHGDESVLGSIGRLDQGLREAEVEFLDLHGRSKNLYSIFNKMKSKGKSLSEVFDRRGLRLIVPDERSCYAALEVVRTTWPREVSGHFKDYIRRPKGNGYQSLHVVVLDEAGHPLEIQIRTEEMHRAAELGVAAHWRYKEKTKGVSCGEGGLLCSSSSFSKEEEEEEGGYEQFAMQRVEWARWLMSWATELTDMKLRLSSGAGLSGSPGSAGRSLPLERGARTLCSFPEHGPDCCFNPECGSPPRPLLPETEPVLVLLVEGEGRVAVKKLQGPTGTRESFVRDYLADRGKLHLLSRASLLVNSELASIGSDRFHMGDQVEVLLDAPLSPELVPSPSHNHSSIPEEKEEEEEEELLFEADAMGGSVLVEGEEALEADLLPGFAREACPLALEFQRRKLAVAFGSTECLELEQNQAK